MSSFVSQLQYHLGIFQKPSWRSCRIRKCVSPNASSKSFIRVILTWRLFSSQEENSDQVSQSWTSIAASRSSTCASIRGSSRNQPHQQWRSIIQASSAARRVQAQVPAQQSSRSTLAGSRSVESSQIMSLNLDWSRSSTSSSCQKSRSQLMQRKNSRSASLNSSDQLSSTNEASAVTVADLAFRKRSVSNSLPRTCLIGSSQKRLSVKLLRVTIMSSL